MAATAILISLWSGALWLIDGTMRKEKLHQNYIKRGISKQLHDNCADGELQWVLRHLDETADSRNLSRSEIRNKIVDIQSQEISKWEFAGNDERTISPTIKKICTQNYDILIDDLEAYCTADELFKICDYVTAENCEKSRLSKLDLSEEIVNAKRTRIYINVTRLMDKYCIERHLEVLAVDLTAYCSGGRVKKLFDKLIKKKRGCDVSCDDCVEKTDYVDAVVEVKRRYYHDVDMNMKPLLNELCMEPELKTLKRKLLDNCSIVQIIKIIDELDVKSTACVEKVDFVNEIIEAKRRQFSVLDINTLIYEFCTETLED